MRTWIAIIVARIASFVLRLLGRRGTSLPGLLAARVAPRLLPDMLAQLETFVAVTGTNGKTTTTALIYAIVTSDGERWITNVEGANLAQGLLAALLPYASTTGTLRTTKAVLEIDEATLPRVTAMVPPTLAVVTNVFRDQLDRYGEVDRALALLKEGLAHPSTQLLVNADDPLAAWLGIERESSRFFGLEGDSSPQDGNEVRDGAFCLLCGSELLYDSFVYGQMGRYRCPIGHFTRPEPDYAGWPRDGQLTVREADPRGAPEYEVRAPVVGLYNLYNVLAAIAAVRILGLSPRRAARGVQFYTPPVGRMQSFPGEPPRILTLIKNPTGANSVLRAIETDARPKQVCLAINDRDADGRDVSWLWDIDLESFVRQTACERWYCAGTRGLDMALRLAYAGVARDAIEVLETLSAVGQAAGRSEKPFYVLSTYTALHPLAEILKEGGERRT